jgi:hypothetical protein
MDPLPLAILEGRAGDAKDLCRAFADTWATPGSPTRDEMCFACGCGDPTAASIHLFLFLASPASELRPDERVEVFDTLVRLGATCTSGDARMAARLALTPIPFREHSRLRVSVFAVRGLHFVPNTDLAVPLLQRVIPGECDDANKAVDAPGCAIPDDVVTLENAMGCLLNVYWLRRHDASFAAVASALVDAGVSKFPSSTLYSSCFSIHERTARVLVNSGVCDPFEESPTAGVSLPTPLHVVSTLTKGRHMTVLMDSRPPVM